jgi:hypothetical protein
MSEYQAGLIARLVEQEEAEQEARIDDKARAMAHGLIQSYIGPDHRVVDMPSFYSALVQAIKQARSV